jgi:ELWxxDGT repeat protein
MVSEGWYGRWRVTSLATSAVAATVLLLAGSALAAETSQLVKDVQLGANGSRPSQLTWVKDTLFFVADDGAHGRELWRSDGTDSGTRLVKDINVAGHSDPASLTAVGRKLFFWANDGVHGKELWRSDGTPTGTFLVKDISPGPLWPRPVHSSAKIVDLDGEAFFGANDLVHGLELWKSNGTGTGTSLVADVSPPGMSPSLASFSDGLTVLGDKVLFIANDGIHGHELWRSDGTEVGTEQVKDIEPGLIGSFPRCHTTMAGRLFFCARDGSSRNLRMNLWTSDGTAAGTTLVKQFDDRISHLTAVGRSLYFVTNWTWDEESLGTSGFELWSSDGTTGGTRLVKPIGVFGLEAEPGDIPLVFSSLGGNLYFGWAPVQGFLTIVGGSELWRSDGTAEGTQAISPVSPHELVSVAGRLAISGQRYPNGPELWLSDGTSEGTVLADDIRPGQAGSKPSSLTPAGRALFFTADDGVHGAELWRRVFDAGRGKARRRGCGPPPVRPVRGRRNCGRALLK